MVVRINDADSFDEFAIVKGDGIPSQVTELWVISDPVNNVKTLVWRKEGGIGFVALESINIYSDWFTNIRLRFDAVTEESIRIYSDWFPNTVLGFNATTEETIRIFSDWFPNTLLSFNATAEEPIRIYSDWFSNTVLGFSATTEENVTIFSTWLDNIVIGVGEIWTTLIPMQFVLDTQVLTIELDPYLTIPNGAINLNIQAISDDTDIISAFYISNGNLLVIVGEGLGTTTIDATVSYELDTVESSESTIINVHTYDPPLWAQLPRFSIPVGETYTVDLAGFVSSPIGSVLEITIQSHEENINPTINGTILTIRATTRDPEQSSLVLNARNGIFDVDVSTITMFGQLGIGRPSVSTSISAMITEYDQTIEPPVSNNPPVWQSIMNRTIEVGETIEINIRDLVSDPDDDALIITAMESSPDISIIYDDATGVLSITGVQIT